MQHSMQAQGRAITRPGPVLVVDDDVSFTTTIARVLRDTGLEVEAANEGAKGLDLARVRPPSVVLVDLVMPGMDGLEFIEACRALPECRRVPIIVITAHTKQLVDSRARLEGQRVLVVLKPFDMDALIGAVRELAAST